MTTHLQNLDWFFSDLELIANDVSKRLSKTLSRKITDAVLQPWTPTKEIALLDATSKFRDSLKSLNAKSLSQTPILNPVDACELLAELDPDESFILPSANIPLLLVWNLHLGKGISETINSVKVDVIALRGVQTEGESFTVQGVINGTAKETRGSTLGPYFEYTVHRWYNENTLSFETRSGASGSGPPKALSLKISSCPTDDPDATSTEVGYAWVNLSQAHNQSIHVPVHPFDAPLEFDQQHGTPTPLTTTNLTLEIAISSAQSKTTRKRLLLYKHGEDLRQEMLALQFLHTCDLLLKASGLNLKMKVFKCCPVDANRGFVEWVEGCVPLSDICGEESSTGGDASPHVGTPNAGHGNAAGWFRYPSMRTFRGYSFGNNAIFPSKHKNPIQDFLRSANYDPESPYFIDREVMDTYVKSCAGYCVATYLLGVGDRHLDNLLLHPEGHFLHCDFSYILGRDPKTYIPMRITEHMVMGMGGRDSDNYSKFLSLAGASFVALRRHSNLRVLLSLLRLMAHSNMPDLSLHQSPEDALLALRYRFRLDLTESEALNFMEQLIEECLTTRLWIAVDSIHNFGKFF